MERFIGEKRALLMNRGTLHVRSIEASLKLVVQDLKGRRRTPLDPRELLCKPTAARASGGGAPSAISCHAFFCALRSGLMQRGLAKKVSQVRDVRPASFSSQSLARAKAAKPRLEKPRKKSNCSEAAFLESHSESCKAAVAALENITSEAEGVLGNKVYQPKRQGCRKEAPDE